MINLNQLKNNEKAKVICVEGSHGFLRKLEALGITPGVEIVKTSSHFMRGPVIVSIRGTNVAIGFGMARRIMVEAFSGFRKQI
ncbi:MAG: hypothetical protein A2297_07985 [Elusimicrobia bacterium RIFOXYB2_FULL_48_7]|nr:MAG: hypothetical protein A2297_07985 [Elusimicrobia bacterium RIFOXYB2_FULL_48_7]